MTEDRPKKILMSGKEYPVEQVLQSTSVPRPNDTGAEEHFHVSLRDYGEADIIYNHRWNARELSERRASKSFSDEFIESAK